MRKVFLLIVIVMATITISAQDGINYQAVVRDDNGDLMKNEAIAVEFNILKTSTSGTVVYTETHALTTNNFGNVVAIIGQGTATLNTFAGIDWASDKHFLNVKINSTDMGTTEFLSVPYAQHASTADALTNPNWVKSGNKVYNENEEIVIGGTLSDAQGLTVNSNTNTITSELVDFKVGTLGLNADVLNLQVNSTSGSGQFIEMINAGEFLFRFQTDGELNTSDRTGDANMLPIAYGTIYSDGTIACGTDNISTSKVSTGKYEIQIDNEIFNNNDYVVTVTSQDSRINTSWGQVGGHLRAYLRDVANTSTFIDKKFSFIVYKP